MDSEDVLIMDAEQIFRGIHFHLYDYSLPFWKYIDEIDEESLADLADRLFSQQPVARILHSAWREWRNVTRLQYLLWKADTVLVQRKNMLKLKAFEAMKGKHV